MSFAGRAANSSGCVARPRAREIGLIGFAAQIRRSSLTGSYVMETAEHREPCESRGSRTVLGATGGEIPPRDSTITSEQYVRRVRGMSASPPIASKLRRRSESTWCANRVLTRRSKSPAIRSPRRRERAAFTHLGARDTRPTAVISQAEISQGSGLLGFQQGPMVVQ